MEILETDKDNNTATIKASAQEWAVLCKLLGWLGDEYKFMDQGKILMNEDEIQPTIAQWYSLTHEALGKD